MRNFLTVLSKHLYQFINQKGPHIEENPEELVTILDTIQLAVYKKAAIHVIYGQKSFTGEIVKWDPDKERLIMKNFQKNVSSLIQLRDIKRISLLPESIQETQKKGHLH
ncbi:hypothetical protein HO675_02390 [Streptococcus suis]|nr:hypothetical protein [Streptococcus suis]